MHTKNFSIEAIQNDQPQIHQLKAPQQPLQRQQLNTLILFFKPNIVQALTE